MELQGDEEESVTNRPAKYGLRVRHVPVLEISDAQSERPVKAKAMSSAERSKRYREKRAADAEKHHLYLDTERKRSRLRRATRSEEQRTAHNAKAAIRNARYRAKKKESLSLPEATVTPIRRSKRLDKHSLHAKRDKERKRAQEYRDTMTPQKRRRVNEKRMRRYYAQKEREKQNRLRACENKDLSVEHDCAQNVFESGENECALAGQNINANINEPSAILCTARDSNEISPDLDSDPLYNALSKTKDKRNPIILKFRNFLFKSLSTAKSKYKKKLGFGRRSKKTGDETKMYKRASKVQSLISSFFEENSVHLPHIKSVSKKTLTQKKILEIPITKLFYKFKQLFPNTEVSQKTFFRHRPKHVLSCKKMPLLQSKCETCMNPALKLKTLNKLGQQSYTIQDIIEFTLCPKDPHTKYNNLECYSRNCKSCGAHSLKELFSSHISQSQNQIVTWSKWDYVTTEKKKHLELVEHQGSVEDLVFELIKELETLPLHVFTYLWQASQYKGLKTSPPTRSAVCTFDFAQNYTCTSQDQPQSAYYGMKQIAIHPVVIHRQCPDRCGGVVTDNIVFLSDDLKHDAYFVKEVTRETAQHLSRLEVNKAFIFSDGASSQYKAKLPFSLVTEVYDLNIERHFFGSRHGKSACDALGGVIKTAAKQAVTNRQVSISDAKDLFAFCCDTLTKEVEGCCGSSRSFHLLSSIPRPKIEPCTLKTVPGTRKLHAVLPLASNVIATRNLSCFCIKCQRREYTNCLNKDYVSSWDKIKLSSSSGKPDPLRELHKIEDQSHFFNGVQAILTATTSFLDFQAKCLQLSKIITKFPLQSSDMVYVRYIKCAVDKIALQLRPDHVPQTFLPLVTVGDGNCMPRSLCLAFSGTDKWHTEMRCRIAIELAIHDKHYLDEDKLTYGGCGDGKILDLITKLSDSIVCGDGENDINTQATFQAETMKTVLPGTYMGMWQLYAAASVLESTIVSVYPSLGWKVFQNLHSRVIKPRAGKAQKCVTVMWSSMRSDMEDRNWVANHIVPLIPMSQNSESDFNFEVAVQSSDSPNKVKRNLWDEIRSMSMN